MRTILKQITWLLFVDNNVKAAEDSVRTSLIFKVTSLLQNKREYISCSFATFLSPKCLLRPFIVLFGTQRDRKFWCRHETYAAQTKNYTLLGNIFCYWWLIRKQATKIRSLLIYFLQQILSVVITAAWTSEF